MREVAQVCDRCGRRRYLQVDAWAGRPGLTGFVRCGRCRLSESADAWKAAVFFFLVVVAILVGVVEALAVS